MSDYEILIPMKKDMDLRLLMDLLRNIAQAYEERGHRLRVNVGYDGDGDGMEIAFSIVPRE